MKKKDEQMNWKDRFSGRLLSADEAVRQIRSGETISIAHVGSEPYALVDALARNADALTDVDMQLHAFPQKGGAAYREGDGKTSALFRLFSGRQYKRGSCGEQSGISALLFPSLSPHAQRTWRCGCASDFRFRAGCAWLLLHGAGD